MGAQLIVIVFVAPGAIVPSSSCEVSESVNESGMTGEVRVAALDGMACG